MKIPTTLLLSLMLTGGLGGCQSESPADGDATASPVAADLQKFRYAVAPYPQRDYYVFTPSVPADQPRPLVVYLHGCNQTGPDVAIGTRWNELAERENVLVVYPEQYRPAPESVQDQVSDGNGTGCWNWFRPEHWQRDAGEPATIAGITREVIARFDADPARVYVLGASAGAIMASTMAATYPDLYAAAGILAGCGYPACGDATGLMAVQAMAERKSQMPIFFMHGSADEVAPLAGGLAGLQQWLATNDYLDDGQRNESVSSEPTAIENVGVDESALAGFGSFGDLCTTGSASPCPGGALGLNDYPYSVAHYADADGQPLIEFWLIHGLMHNYPGGNTEGSFVDPMGPDITRAAWQFFRQITRMP